MATLILSEVGKRIGGPVGSAIGALAGRFIDQQLLFKPRGREGPRLTDLAVQTSQYGSAVPRIYGTMRVAGTVIWATDLTESSKTEGGKGQPKTTTYSYSVSFAVALSSRPVAEVRRIWAEGNLLRGAAGDFKSETGFRLHPGHADQQPDPLIAAAEGADAPAYRGIAYAVFEDMQLADFGNRIPSLTFELVAEDGTVTLAQICGDLIELAAASRFDQQVLGYAASGADAGEELAAIGAAVPFSLDDGPDGLVLTAHDVLVESPDTPVLAGDPLRLEDGTRGYVHRRGADPRLGGLALRYYEPERDYQAGLRRARNAGPDGAGSGEVTIDFPAALAADAAQGIADRLLRARLGERESIELACAELDFGVRPGQAVRIEGRPGLWRVSGWRWEGGLVRVDLVRVGVSGTASVIGVEAGRLVSAPDLPAGPTAIQLLDLPPSFAGFSTSSRVVAALSGGTGWRGARVLGATVGGDAGEAIGYVRTRAVMGQAVDALPPGSSQLVDLVNSVQVDLLPSDRPLLNADAAALAAGANLCALGQELLQFGRAEMLSETCYRLSCLWRGRGGTETAMAGHVAGEPFVLIDTALYDVPADAVTPFAPLRLFALGRGDGAPVATDLATTGRALVPLSPVHLRAEWRQDGGLEISWVRRSRSGFAWRDLADAPLGEELERYEIALFDGVDRLAGFEAATAMIALSAGEAAPLMAAIAPRIEIVQRGTFAASAPATLDLFV